MYCDLVKELIGDKIKKACVITYGCQQNVNDGEKLKGFLDKMGYSICENLENCDVVIYNTCAVRENAEDRVFGNIGALKHKKLKNPNMIICLCGCMMQQPHIVEKIKKSFSFVDMIFGTHVMNEFPKMLYNIIKTHKKVYNIDDSNSEIVENMPIIRDKKFQAWLPIMYGCNNFCTYCIVPYVRGRERSRKYQDVVTEFKSLIADGYKEITLLGQNVNSYNGGMTFAELLKLLNDIDGDFRIRFMTSHPKDATKELVDAIKSCDKVCKHFHLPVQSGSNRILKLMNRNYTIEKYLELIEYGKGLSFTTDIIVGFPGETYEDFSQTLELIKKVRFDSLFSFIYSKRVGTKAALMEDNISDAEKSKWFQELLQTQRAIGRQVYSSCVGKTYKVLVEGHGKEGGLTGRNEQYMIVNFDGDDSYIGNFVNIKITKALNWALEGELV